MWKWHSLRLCIGVIGMSLAGRAAGGVEATIEFAPQEGLIKAPEMPYRGEVCLNGQWRFQPVPLPEGWRPRQGQAPKLTPPQKDRWETTPIRIPSPWNVNGFAKSDGPDNRTFPSYPAAWEDVQMGWLEREFTVPVDWVGKRVFVHFEAVCGMTEVYVNDRKVGENFDLFLPFSFDVTEQVKVGEVNKLRVGVRSPRLFEDDQTVGRRPFPGGSMWAQEIAGIWQDVYLHAFSPVRVSDVFIQPLVSEGMLKLDIELTNDTQQPVKVSVGGQISPWINLAGDDPVNGPVPQWELGKTVLGTKPITANIGPDATITLTIDVSTDGRLKYWTPETPNLYALVLDLKDGSQTIDRKYQRFGWRQWSIQGSKHLLNGKPYELRGDSWHCLGVTQLTRRYPWSWYTAIKQANGNAARPHAQVYPRFFMDVADEMGIAILSETANWASDGGPKFDSEAYWLRSEEQLRRLILRDRNHASVFGWSVSNENRPVIIHVMRRPDLLPRQIEEWRRWTKIARELDPTRPWISGDGEGDGEGVFPTVVGHYGDRSMMTEWANQGKPWGVGEHSMAYYGTPLQVSKINGVRAYESMEGRMEGLAYEVYDLISTQRELNASYVSVFNLAWYSLEPLPLGMKDVSQPPALEDGIHFLGYVEGKPGYQPERIGPYSTSFNPGYDPDLPLFIAWPMWEAIRDAYARGGPAPSRWANAPKPSEEIQPRRSIPAPVEILTGGESMVPTELSMLGVVGVAEGRGHHLIIDGQDPPTSAGVGERVRDILAEGGTVLVWSPSRDRLNDLNGLLPIPVELGDREATSFLVVSDSPVVRGLTHADFYFSEIQKKTAIRHGLVGPLIKHGTVLATASDTDWRRWNKVAETIKASSVLRSERESKGPGTVLAEAKLGGGRVVVSTLENITASEQGVDLMRKVLANIGIDTDSARVVTGGRALDPLGRLRIALVAGSFGAASMDAAAANDWIGEADTRPHEGDQANDRRWTQVDANEGGIFDFRSMDLKGPGDHAAAYLSFWVWTPRPLDDLLAEPDMPQLDLLVGADDSFKIWLNGDLLCEEFREGPINPGEFCYEGLPLKTGWNHFLVKVSNRGGDWGFTAHFESSDQQFVTEMRSALERPDTPKPAKTLSEGVSRLIQSGIRDDGLTYSLVVTGDWYDNLWAFSGPGVTATWSEMLPAAGRYALEIRYGPDPNQDHAQDVTFVIPIAGGETTRNVNLRDNTDQWNRLGEWSFDQKVSITLDATNADGNVIVFEARFIPIDQ